MKHRSVERRADAHAGEHARQPLAEPVGERRLDEDARQARTALAGRRADRERGLGDGEFEICVRAHQHCVLAAHLEREQLARLIERRFGERASRRPRAGEEHAVDARVQRQATADVGAALHDFENAVGQAGFAPKCCEQRAHGGCELARFEDDRIARRERRDDVPVGKMGGEVEGAEHSEHAARMEGGARAGAGLDRRDPAHAVGERRIDLRGEQLCFAARVPERLADFAGDEPRHLLAALARERSEATQHGGTRFEAAIAPLGKGAARARHGVVHGARIRHREATDLVGRVGGSAGDEQCRP